MEVITCQFYCIIIFSDKCSPIDFSTSTRPLMTYIGHAQQSKSVSDCGPSSFGSRIVLIPPTNESAAGSKTALLIKNEVKNNVTVLIIKQYFCPYKKGI